VEFGSVKFKTKKMKYACLIISAWLIFTSCASTKNIGTGYQQSNQNTDTLFFQSLFNDKASTISEDKIQKILEGTY